MHYIQEKKGKFSEFPPHLSPAMNEYLVLNGIKQLYSHQVEALNLIANGKNVAVVTPTASGKTMIYNIPVIESCLKDEKTRALYLYPLKALAQDQFKTINEFKDALFPKDRFLASVYDGDTSSYQRQKIRRNPPNILVTNPDMLHLGILPYHSGWAEYFKNLKFVVIDEIHSYRGVFGSHVAHVLRRLRRICGHYGSNPQFITSSATIANPEEFINNLTGLEFSVISESGAPSSAKYFALWNSQESPYTDAAHLVRECITYDLKTIVFTKARKVTELIYQWITNLGDKYYKKVAAYRAGYLPEERREIEKKLFSGELLGVISTSALEVGIDIGGLDVCILVGYPGSMMSTWQRGGRVGRIDDALIILIGLQDAIDQYFMAHPENFFKKECESAVVDTGNKVIAGAHLICSAFELPLTEADKIYYGAYLSPIIEELASQNKLQKSDDGRYFSPGRHPERFTSIRSIGDSFVIVDLTKNTTIGEIDYPRVLSECFPSAIYLHAGVQYEVAELDLLNKKVRVKEADVDYFTQPRSSDDVEVLEVLKQKKYGKISVKLGRVKVTEMVAGYVRKKMYNQTVFDEHSLTLPPHIFETVALWFAIPNTLRETVHDGDLGDFRGGIHAVEHAVISIFPLFALCDRLDLGGVSYEIYQGFNSPGIFIYDAHPGGVGLAEKAYEIIHKLVAETLNMVKSCPCETGCPSCIQSNKCGNGNKPLDKNVCMWLLNKFLEDGEPGEEEIVEKYTNKVLSSHPLETTQQENRFKGKNIVFLDIETQKSAAEVGGWNNKHLMKVACIVTYSTIGGKYLGYTEDRIKECVDEILKADIVVGFNIKSFDWAVLQPYTNVDLGRIKTLDLLEVVKNQLNFRLSLDHLSLATLKKGKTADGLQSLQWFKEGKIQQIIEYCQYDVQLTRELYEYALEHKHLLYVTKEGQPLQIPLDLNKYI
ncbi:MAG: DEAD/DEAH box helicase [Candidatus Firestonebacteria bacterium]